MKKLSARLVLEAVSCSLVLLVVLFAAYLFVYYTPEIITKWSGATSPPSSQGEFGDQFGLTNAVFSGIALSFVALTLFLQTRELRLQRKEIDETQGILSHQTEILSSQTRGNVRAGFESTFFRLLDLHNYNQSSLKSASVEWTIEACQELVLHGRSADGEAGRLLADKNLYSFSQHELDEYERMCKSSFGRIRELGIDLADDDHAIIMNDIADRVAVNCAYAILAPRWDAEFRLFYGNFVSMVRYIDTYVESHSFVDYKDGLRYAEIACNLLSNDDRQVLALHLEYMGDAKAFSSCISYDVFDIKSWEGLFGWVGKGHCHVHQLPFVWKKPTRNSPAVRLDYVNNDFVSFTKAMIKGREDVDANLPPGYLTIAQQKCFLKLNCTCE